MRLVSLCAFRAPAAHEMPRPPRSKRTVSKFSVSLEREQLRKAVVTAFQRCIRAHAASATSVPYHLRSFNRRKWQRSH